MHMSDALITPVVGGVMFISSIGVGKYSLKKLKEDLTSKIPLMAIMGAFIFAFQMINFTIPGTGSSGHIGGGLLLSTVLGPYAGFLTLGVVLFIQALFFADGGVLALGCNLINLGFFTCFVTYPLIFRVISQYSEKKSSTKRVMFVCVIASIIGLQFGSLGVVFQTYFSGRTDLPLEEFLGLMQGIHLLIGLIEGVITGIIVKYLLSHNPKIIYGFSSNTDNYRNRGIIFRFAICTVVLAGVISIYASNNPDGLEWSILQITGNDTPVFLDKTLAYLSNLQNDIAFFPDYDLKESLNKGVLGTSLSGIVGSLLVFLLVFIIGLFRRKRKLRSE